MEMTYQIESVLSSEQWKKVTVKEGHEPLVEVKETDHIVHGSRLRSVYNSNSYFLRKTAAEMLRKASLDLPKGYRLAIIEGVRNIERQRELWDIQCARLAQRYPNLSAANVEQLAVQTVARPGPLANHNCGGAVDVALVTADNKFVDMGSYPQDVSDKDIVVMHSSLITFHQRANRELLRSAMIRNGFVYYPGEWWHYCYGDRMWAVYTGRQHCQYGPIQALYGIEV